ncbi:MerR family transcriptional regulator [Thermoflavimicrobium daqui]|uniref:MerR family transcriptional regulator n=1 Tax=Thermoflavimicrobium daqui TaxID=2137476 RepID=A0A364K2H9_9BACL|nr:MerR family transcriptional regulator [Thermoflavimicrobium daqui]RAL22541.1 MerR family transcriptional regulator [Thermoflavimicrobium daqui]
MRDHIRRNMPLLPMRIVTTLTELTPRQIRYYEQQQLIHPARTSGNQRLFSFNDVERLLEIKALIEKGVNTAGVKEVLVKSQQVLIAKQEVEKVKKELSEKELRKMLKQQLTHPLRPGQTLLNQGEMTRFFRH